MFDEPSYLAWAIRRHGKAAFDLATSGIARVPLAELGAPPDLDDPRAWPELRSAIARHLDAAEETVIPALGTAHAVFLAYASVASPGDEILVESPGYEPLVRAASGLGAHVARFVRRREDRYAVDPDAVMAKVTPQTKLVVVSNLHNPTGVRTPDPVLGDLAARLAARGAWLLVDEVYAPFDALASADGVWRGSATRLGTNVLGVSSLTKCYGLGAHRFGWLAGPREAIARAEAAVLATCGMLPLAHAALGVLAFRAVPRLAERARALLGDKRRLVASWVAARDDLAFSDPAEGLFGFAHLRESPGAGGALSAPSALRLALDRGFDELGVAVTPGEFFEMPDGFRLAWSLPEPELTLGLARLGQVLDLFARRS